MGLTRPGAAAPDRQVAIALGYDRRTDRAPRILGLGRGETAREILALARDHGIAIREDGDLTALLERIPLFEEIPPRLYPVVAEVLLYVYRMSRALAPDSADLR